MSVSDIYKSIAELGYAVAKADGGMQSVEKEEFYRIMQEDLYPHGGLAESRFEILENLGKLSVEQAYKSVMVTIKRNRAMFTVEMKDQFLLVMNKIAEAYNGIEEREQALIERFINDLEALDAKKVK